MKSGAIDASEWVGPWNDMAFGFHQVAKYYYCPGFQEPGAMLATAMRVVNAVGYVVDAEPGLLRSLEMPLTLPRYAFRT